MKKKVKPLVVFLLVFCLITAFLSVLFWPFIKDLRNPAYRLGFSAWVKDLGALGVAVLFGLQVLQIIVAVIPGGPVELIAGAAYGALGGLAICVSGCVLASSLVFMAVRKAGLPLVRRFFDLNNMRFWKFLQNPDKTVLAVFIVFLIPGTPKDMLTWFAPLSSLSLPGFVIISTFARIPAILSAAIMGDSLIAGSWNLFLIIFLITAVTGFLGIFFRRKIMEKFNRSKPEHMTCLYGNKLGEKNNPVIVFRGKADSLAAMIAEAQLLGKKNGNSDYVNDLEEIIVFIRTIFSAEYTHAPLSAPGLLGLTFEEIHERSHHTEKFYGRKHLCVHYSMGPLVLRLNTLRAAVRETELAAISAFKNNRGDIIEAFNRLSSLFYILMYKYLPEDYTEVGSAGF
jgi:uncharacterized membrane protein YdjX (TVP38/TMEM64 family)/cob(I)alamin adenosyltransferase